jgi:hypothetical protein
MKASNRPTMFFKKIITTPWDLFLRNHHYHRPKRCGPNRVSPRRMVRWKIFPRRIIPPCRILSLPPRLVDNDFCVSASFFLFLKTKNKTWNARFVWKMYGMCAPFKPLVVIHFVSRVFSSGPRPNVPCVDKPCRSQNVCWPSYDTMMPARLVPCPQDQDPHPLHCLRIHHCHRRHPMCFRGRIFHPSHKMSLRYCTP